MALRRHRFFFHEKADDSEHWYDLIADDVSGHVYVAYECRRVGERIAPQRIELVDFLHITPADRYPYHYAALADLFRVIAALLPVEEVTETTTAMRQKRSI